MATTLQNLTSPILNSTDISNSTAPPSSRHTSFAVDITIAIIGAAIIFLPIVLYIMAGGRCICKPTEPFITTPAGRLLAYAMPMPSWRREWRRKLDVIDGVDVPAGGSGAAACPRERRGSAEQNERNLRRQAGVWTNWIQDLRAQGGIPDDVDIELGEVCEVSADQGAGEEPQGDNGDQESGDGSGSASGDRPGEEGDAQQDEGEQDGEAGQRVSPSDLFVIE